MEGCEGIDPRHEVLLNGLEFLADFIDVFQTKHLPHHLAAGAHARAEASAPETVQVAKRPGILVYRVSPSNLGELIEQVDDLLDQPDILLCILLRPPAGVEQYRPQVLHIHPDIAQVQRSQLFNQLARSCPGKGHDTTTQLVLFKVGNCIGQASVVEVADESYWH